MMQTKPQLHFVVCANNRATLNQYFLASPCIANKRYPVQIVFDQSSAGAAYNPMHDQHYSDPANTWLVWVHQDVFLPQGWDEQFVEQLSSAQSEFAHMRVAGVYGVQGHAPQTLRAGHVLDRGKPLVESTPLPCLVDSLDELLIATRADAKLGFDPALGFDFYGTDIVLCAQAQGYLAVVVNAPCEHWSHTPQFAPFPAALENRITQSAQVFEHKWRDHLPLATPCFEIDQPGATAQFFNAHRHA